MIEQYATGSVLSILHNLPHLILPASLLGEHYYYCPHSTNEKNGLTGWLSQLSKITVNVRARIQTQAANS